MVDVYRSTIINAPADTVWHFVRDFNGHERWHPAIKESHIEAGMDADQVGAVRRFTLTDGGELRERLLTLSDLERSYSYCILASPIPLLNYVAHVRVRPVTDGGLAFWEWWSSFNTPAGRENELAELVGEGIYQAGFDAARPYIQRDR